MEFKLTFKWELTPIKDYFLKSISLLAATNDNGNQEVFDTNVHTFFHSAFDKMNDIEKNEQENLFSQTHDGVNININTTEYKAYVEFNKKMIDKHIKNI